MRTGCARAVVRLEARESGRSTLVEIELVPGRRDQVLRGRQRVSRAEDLLETLRVTVFTPDDLVLVKGGPQERRAYLDDLLEASSRRLAQTRQTLERVLRQRATLLKQAGGRASPEVVATLDVWDAQLAAAGGELVAAREALVRALGPAASGALARLTGRPEELQLTYQRSYAGELADALASARAEDLRRAVTTVGPHRDELVVMSGGLDARTRLSQGRQRAVTLALRLAGHEVVRERTGSRPVLLLDDAFSELDEATARALVEQLPAGQAILTTAGALPPGAAPAAALRLADGGIRS